MGRHRGGPEGREDEISGARGSRAGFGRRRRGSGTGPDAAGGPGAVQAPRGGQSGPQQHPDHTEHGAWGAAADWPASPGFARSPGGRLRSAEPSALDDPAEQDALGGWPGIPAPPSRGGTPSRIPRPRPDVADAFEAFEAFDAFGGPRPGTAIPGQRSGPVAPGRQGSVPGAPRVPGVRAAGRVPGPRKDFLEAFDDVRPAAPAVGGETRGGSAEEAPARGSGSKGRSLAGVAAAVVMTVLAVLVAGQVAGAGRIREGAQAPVDGAAPSGTSSAQAGSSASAPAVSLSYAEAMATVYPLDQGLALSDTFTTIGGHQKAPGKGQVLRVRVDVEKGLPLDGELFAQAVYKTLNDERSWGHDGTKTFERVSSGHADIVITLASPGTTAKWCAKSGLDTTDDNVSCDSVSTPRTMINAYRWAQGSKTYGQNKMYIYREMLINHEVGHRLGHSHVVCPKDGALAPVMMQQTKFLTLNGKTCKPNPWPFPEDG
ncbi:DUF3152 domain-containing protein [Actinacidiphila oryziradicis]|uniref:DUF3152 domain-containing protein n=1 Tax=Actinacidiphila oryziradicis TaxID=2571141 RepID=A0A4V5N048_9ACTN|nr:DUF3152 domain-containing protein [Actinacidiphila oryziradicis]TKA10599.1 DUF3152 domain-containing protein [Actinacidiphila oryziradicis]